MKKNGLGYPLQIGAALCFGCLAGLGLGQRAWVLGELGTLLIQVLKTLATPLVFFAVVDAFCKTRIRARSGLLLVVLSTVNAVIAGGIALALSSFSLHGSKNFQSLAETLAIGTQASLPEVPQLDFVKILSGFIPKNVLEPFIQNNVISVVFLSVLVGLVFRELKNSKENDKDLEVLERFFSAGFQLISGILGWVVQLVPFAVFGVVAKIVGTSGFGFLYALGFFVTLVTAGILIHGVIYYSLLLFFIARTSPLKFFRDGTDAFVTAFGTGSSLATLPVTLNTLQAKMKVSVESSRLSACVGTNLNHNGILLYEAAAALFIAQVHGISLGINQKVLLLCTSAFAAVGIAGVPEAGLVTLSLVLSTLGLPLTLVPVLMAVDWWIGRLRATSNVTSDMVVATLLDRLK